MMLRKNNSRAFALNKPDRSNRFGTKMANGFLFKGSLTNACNGNHYNHTLVNTNNSVRYKRGQLYLYAENGGSVDDEFELTNSIPTLDNGTSRPRQTVVLIFTPETVVSGVNCLLEAGNQTGNGIRVTGNSAGYLEAGYDGGNGFNRYFRSGNDVFAAGKRVVVACSVDSDNNKISVVVDGVDAESDWTAVGLESYIGGGSILPTNPNRLSGRTGGFNQFYHFRGAIEMYALYYDFYSTDQLRDLCADPYQAFSSVPLHEPAYFFGEAGPGPTFQPAWARHANTILGSGGVQ